VDIGNIVIMGRPKHEHYWKEVDKEKDGKLKCKKCGHKFKAGVSRIEAHIKGTGGIRKCSPPLNDTTSSNHSEQHMNAVIDTSPGTTISHFSLTHSFFCILFKSSFLLLLYCNFFKGYLLMFLLNPSTAIYKKISKRKKM